MKPFSEACERNKQSIFQTIYPFIKSRKSVLEIGSGNGQHAVYFSQKLPQLIWHTSDRKENHAGINLWIDDSEAENLERPISLDVIDDPWPKLQFDTVYSANTAHIMPWRAVQACFEGISKVLDRKGVFILYGPFNYNGQFTSQSNRQFEGWLKSVDPQRGIRDFEKVDELANLNHMRLLQDIEMPANNRILIWQKE